jgi:hypothetical protein
MITEIQVDVIYYSILFVAFIQMLIRIGKVLFRSDAYDYVFDDRLDLPFYQISYHIVAWMVASIFITIVYYAVNYYLFERILWLWIL